MTLSKASLGEALADLDVLDASDDQHILDVRVAARFVERLLPGTCDCGGTGVHPNDEPWPHPDCGGSGQLWDEGLVEALWQALADYCDNYDDAARAVLSALTQEVGK